MTNILSSTFHCRLTIKIRNEMIMRRKIIIHIIVVVLLLSGCTTKREIRVGDSADRVEGCYKSLGSFSIKNEDGICTVYVSDDSKITGIAKFDADRNILDADHVNLIHSDDINEYLDWSVEEMEATLGDVYGVMGGFFSPAYITDDGYLIWLRVTAMYSRGMCYGGRLSYWGNVRKVVKIDIFTGEIVEMAGKTREMFRTGDNS